MSRQWSVIITRRTIAAHLPFTPDHDTAHRHDPDSTTSARRAHHEPLMYREVAGPHGYPLKSAPRVISSSMRHR